MFFIFRDKGRTFFPPHPEYKVIQTDSGSITVKQPLKRLIAVAFGGNGFKTNALPVRHGKDKAEGFLDTAKEKSRPNMTQEEADEFLMNHRDYGIDFVAVGDDGKTLTPLQWDSPAHRSEPFLSDSGEGKYCSLCEKQVDMRGLHKHIDSKVHLNLLAEAEKQAIGNIRMGGAG